MQFNFKGTSWNVITGVWGFCCKPVLPNTDLANRLADELSFRTLALSVCLLFLLLEPRRFPKEQLLGCAQCKPKIKAEKGPVGR